MGGLKIIAKEEKDGEHKLRFFLKKKKKTPWKQGVIDCGVTRRSSAFV